MSSFGFFRTGDAARNYSAPADLPSDAAAARAWLARNKKVHVTNIENKIQRGEYVKAGGDAEVGFATAGTLQKYWRLVRAAGLDAGRVRRDVRRLLARLFAGDADGFDRGAWRTTAVARARYTTFYADVGVDARGGVSLLEIHPNCALKPCGVGRKEMSACYDPVITNNATRKGAWGALLLGMADYVESAHLAKARRWVALADDDGSGEDDRVLASLVHEEFLAPLLGMERVLPASTATADPDPGSGPAAAVSGDAVVDAMLANRSGFDDLAWYARLRSLKTERFHAAYDDAPFRSAADWDIGTGERACDPAAPAATAAGGAEDGAGLEDEVAALTARAIAAERATVGTPQTKELPKPPKYNLGHMNLFESPDAKRRAEQAANRAPQHAHAGGDDGRKFTLIIAGAQKSGTTAASFFLNQHPDIWMQESEGQYFNSGGRKGDNFAKGAAWYHRLLRAAPPGLAVYGERTPEYMTSLPFMRRARAYNPALKVLVILRDPVTRLQSAYVSRTPPLRMTGLH